MLVVLVVLPSGRVSLRAVLISPQQEARLTICTPLIILPYLVSSLSLPYIFQSTSVMNSPLNAHVGYQRIQEISKLLTSIPDDALATNVCII